MMRRIGLVTTSRADLAPLRPVMAAIAAHPRLALEVYATGMHLAEGFRHSLDDLGAAGFAPVALVPSIDGDGPAGAALAIGKGTQGFAYLFARSRPDILVVLGDRFDMLPAVLAALPFRLPVAHLHGGEVTFGAIDESIRHAVTKMAHLHFVSTPEYGRRVQALGEEDWRIFVVGAPGLDNLDMAPRLGRVDLAARLGVAADRPYTLATLHPETLADLSPERQADIFATAARRVSGQVVLTAPNADPGWRPLRERLMALAAERPDTIWLEGAGPDNYPSLLRHSAAVVGNSSSGIIEAGYFGRPVVDIGGRQAGRAAGANVVHTEWNADAISAAWAEALSEAGATRAAQSPHPYGGGGAANRIADTLAAVSLGQELTRKLFVDRPFKESAR